ncbi:adhesion G protein-coupled receptor E2-like, partial [Dendroctonus ponderosae]
MDTLYTARLHGYPTSNRSAMDNNITEESVLSLLIVLGSSLSLVALVFAFITYSLFSDLRNLSGTTLMNLLSALFMTQLLYVIGVGGVMDSELCIALASALHYVRLCVFSWMLLMTHNMYMQYKTGLHLVPITDTNISRNFIRYSLLGWGLPLVFLLASILIQYCDKRGMLLDTQDLRRQNCWFLDKNAFISSLVIPGYLMALMTFFYLFRTAVLSKYLVGFQPDNRLRDKMRRKSAIQIILFSKITIVLCICLALATMSKLTNSDGVWISFHIVQGLQGIFIAMLVTCNCQVLKLYTRSLKTRAIRHIPSYVGKPSTSGLNKST